MTDFRKSFQIGLAEHQKASRAREEIAGVLRSFAEQIHEASDERILVEHATSTRQKIAEMAVVAGSALLGMQRLPMSHGALVARRMDGGAAVELCEYELGKHGYPITLIYGRTRESCHDRQSLETGLRILLEDPDTGGKLRPLMSAGEPALPATESQLNPP